MYKHTHLRAYGLHARPLQTWGIPGPGCVLGYSRRLDPDQMIAKTLLSPILAAPRFHSPLHVSICVLLLCIPPQTLDSIGVRLSTTFQTVDLVIDFRHTRAHTHLWIKFR